MPDQLLHFGQVDQMRVVASEEVGPWQLFLQFMEVHTDQVFHAKFTMHMRIAAFGQKVQDLVMLNKDRPVRRGYPKSA